LAKRSVTRFLCKHATIDVARTILNDAFKGIYYFEGELDYKDDSWNIPLNDGWREAIGKRIIINADLSGFYLDKTSKPFYIVSKQLAKKIKESFPEVEVYGVDKDDSGVFYHPVQETAKMRYILKKALEALKEMEYPVNYPIQIVQFNDDSVLGIADADTIGLSEKLFEKGIREVAVTIMEENEHLITNYKDKTRELQNHLFNKWLCTMEERFGIFL